MSFGAVNMTGPGNTADVVTALVRAEGTAAHPYPGSGTLLLGSDAACNLADAVHLLCVLHGRHPGIVDLAADRASAETRPLLEQASAAFALERGYITRLVVAAGPLPSTPGQAESEAAVLGQRHALEMLASSDRTGCALGTALALLLDWGALRCVLDATARRFGMDVPPATLPVAETLMRLTQGLSPGAQRAVTFGAQQLLVQHRGLWDLLEAREVARRAI